MAKSGKSFKEELEYLKDSASEELCYFIPFVVTDPDNIVDMEKYIPYSHRVIDLAQVKAGDLEIFLGSLATGDVPLILFKNIDKISSRKDKEAWESVIVCGLKSENKTFVFKNSETVGGLKKYELPFDKIKIIGTCSVFPEYLTKRGNLGKGPDFS